MSVKATKRATLLADTGVKRWYDNLARGSHITAEVRLRRISRFCETIKLTPKSIIQQAKKNQRKFEDLLEDYVTNLEDQGKAPGYISGILKAIRSWLTHNEIELKRKIKVTNPNATPTIENERVPEKEELRTILMNGTPRANAIVVLMAQAGLRPESLGNESATDGITIGDLPELKIEKNRVAFTKTPMIVKARAPISKSGRAYFSFLPNEGCEYLSTYLNNRLAAGERLKPESPIIRVREGFEKKGKSDRNRGSLFISTKNVSREVREAIRPQYTWRPYVLRAYFDTALLEAENHGKISHPYSVFFMGHTGDMEARYTTNKGRLPEHLIEDMRTSFQNCESYLVTRKKEGMTEEGVIATFNRQYLQLAGYTDEEIDKMGDLSQVGTDDMQKLIKKKSMQILGLNGNSKQRIVPMHDVRNWITEGWEYVTRLPSKEAVIRLPASS